MNKLDKQDWYLMLLSLYYQASDAGTEQVPDEELLHELLEVINENRPCMGVDQYLS